MLEAARRYGVERTIHCSTIGVHGDVKEIPCTETSPLNPGDVYQVSKLAGEEAAHKAFTNGLPGSIFRPATIYGPGDLRLLKLFKTIHARTFRMFGNGKTLLHPVYIDDLVEGIILCAEHPAALGQTFILGGREYVPLNEVVQLVADAVGVKPPRGNLPVWPLIGAAVVCEGLCRPLGYRAAAASQAGAFLHQEPRLLDRQGGSGNRLRAKSNPGRRLQADGPVVFRERASAAGVRIPLLQPGQPAPPSQPPVQGTLMGGWDGGAGWPGCNRGIPTGERAGSAATKESPLLTKQTTRN